MSGNEFGFGLAHLKREDHTLNPDTGESHPTTDAERAEAARNTVTYMEIRVDPAKESRADIHARVDEWLNDWEAEHPGKCPE